MTQGTQFCVGLENKPGELTKLCGALNTNDVEIEALFVSSDKDCAWLNFIASPTDVVEAALCEGGYKFFTEDVLVLSTEDRWGALGRVASKLAEVHVNINYVYGSSRKGDRSVLVLSTDDMARAAEALDAG